MKQNLSISRQFLPILDTENEYTLDIMVAALKNEPNLVEGEDYFQVGKDWYIRLNGALYLIGRFAFTNTWLITNEIERLAGPEAKGTYYYSDSCLPDMKPSEREWFEKISKIVKQNANFLGLSDAQFLHKVYEQMKSSLLVEKAEYLEKHNLPPLTRVAFLRFIACKKELRIDFEATMGRIMTDSRYQFERSGLM